MEIRKNRMTGYCVRARRITGARWLVYTLKDDDKPDHAGNRKAIDIVMNRKEAYQIVKNLDEPED